MAREPTTAERERDTGPLPPLPRRPAGRRWLWPALGLLGLAALGLAVALALNANAARDRRPVEVVRAFVGAVEARDPSRMLTFVEPTIFRREIGPEVRAYVAYIQQIRFDDARYELLSNDGETARVRWTASMSYQLRDLGGGTRPVDTTFELTRIEGGWYISAAHLPETQP